MQSSRHKLQKRIYNQIKKQINTDSLFDYFTDEMAPNLETIIIYFQRIVQNSEQISQTPLTNLFTKQEARELSHYLKSVQEQQLKKASPNCDLDRLFIIVEQGLKINLALNLDVAEFIHNIFSQTELLQAILFYLSRYGSNKKIINSIDYIVNIYIIRIEPRQTDPYICFCLSKLCFGFLEFVKKTQSSRNRTNLLCTIFRILALASTSLLHSILCPEFSRAIATLCLVYSHPKIYDIYSHFISQVDLDMPRIYLKGFLQALFLEPSILHFWKNLYQDRGNIYENSVFIDFVESTLISYQDFITAEIQTHYEHLLNNSLLCFLGKAIGYRPAPLLFEEKKSLIEERRHEQSTQERNLQRLRESIREKKNNLKKKKIDKNAIIEINETPNQ